MGDKVNMSLDDIIMSNRKSGNNLQQRRFGLANRNLGRKFINKRDNIGSLRNGGNMINGRNFNRQNRRQSGPYTRVGIISSFAPFRSFRFI